MALSDLMERLARDEPVELDEPPEVTLRAVRGSSVIDA
jgi:hypothetical protein